MVSLKELFQCLIVILYLSEASSNPKMEKQEEGNDRSKIYFPSSEKMLGLRATPDQPEIDPVQKFLESRRVNVLEAMDTYKPDLTTTSSRPTTSELQQRFNVDPCAAYIDPKPDFNDSSRRISHNKCEEYKWELKYMKTVQKRNTACEKKKRGSKLFFINGGQRTRPGEFPHMGALGWRTVENTWLFYCGSSLISHKFCLTAAHCSSVPQTVPPTLASTKPMIVRFGNTNLKNSTEHQKDIKILHIHVHDSYKSPKPYYDIALVELDEEVAFTSHILPACLLDEISFNSFGNKATVTGWGVYKFGKPSADLLKGTINLVGVEECRSKLSHHLNRHFNGVLDHQLCAADLTDGGVDTCQGDSGGPLQVPINLPRNIFEKMYHVIGVTSFGIGCSNHLPGVYTRVSYFLDWIEKIVWP